MRQTYKKNGVNVKISVLNFYFAFFNGEEWLTKNGLVKMGNDFYEIFAAKPLFLDRVLKV